MDRNLLRKVAKQEYKKMFKGTPRAQRPSFAQAWPLIRATLEGKDRETAEPTQNLTAEDASVLDEMIVEDVTADVEHEHVHGPDCNHESEVAA